MRMKINSILTISAFILAGCVVPKFALRNYTENFGEVKTTDEQMYLRADVIAENIAERPETEGTTAEKLKSLVTRKEALGVRLAALDLIDQYNHTLTALANGTDAKALQDDLTSLSNGLASFNSMSLIKLIGNTSPYLGIIAQGITAVDNAIQKKKFLKAVTEAQKPLLSILDILIEDVASLENVIVQEIKREQDPHREQVDSAAKRFFKAVKKLKPTDDLESSVARHNDVRRKMNRKEMRLIEHQPETIAENPTAADIEALNILTDQTELNVIAYNKMEQRIKAQTELFARYKEALQSTKKAFTDLASEIKTNRFSGVSEFIKQAAELRKAALRVKEAQ